jgi:hypothetical protein
MDHLSTLFSLVFCPKAEESLVAGITKFTMFITRQGSRQAGSPTQKEPIVVTHHALLGTRHVTIGRTGSKFGKVPHSYSQKKWTPPTLSSSLT